MFEIFQYSFMVRAFIAGIVIACTAPLIGTFLVIKRYSLIADTLSHVALAGVAIGLLLGLQPQVVTMVITIITAVFIERLRSNNKVPAEAVLAMFLPAGLALSIVLMSLANGFNTNLFSYLFGSITTVQLGELWLMIPLGCVTVITVLFLYKKLLYVAFDEDSARVSGVEVTAINTVLMVLTAVVVSLSMRIVGALLIGALMVIPVVTAMQIARSFMQTLMAAVVFALVAVVGGLYASFYFDLPAGGIIVLFSLAMFLGVSVYRRL